MGDLKGKFHTFSLDIFEEQFCCFLELVHKPSNKNLKASQSSNLVYDKGSRKTQTHFIKNHKTGYNVKLLYLMSLAKIQ